MVVHGGGYVERPSYYRPYYSFRPRVSLGYGVWSGYPVAYPYYYGYPYASTYAYPAAPYDPYAYSATPAYPSQRDAYPSPNYPSSAYPSDYYGASGQGYPQQQQYAPSVGMQQGGQQQPAAGGVSFAITPENAEVFVDGRDVGAVGNFGPSSQPLGLSLGRHRIEIRASGYRTMTFDADVRPGQVIPYQGDLQRN